MPGSYRLFGGIVSSVRIARPFTTGRKREHPRRTTLIPIRRGQRQRGAAQELRGPLGAFFLCVFAFAQPPGLAAAPAVKNPVVVQAKKDLQAHKNDLVTAALEPLLATELTKTVKTDATIILGQAYLDKAAGMVRGANKERSLSRDPTDAHMQNANDLDGAASATFDKAIALLEPLLDTLAAGDRSNRDTVDRLLSQAYMNNADANIRRKNFNQALISLQSFSAKYPERFDQANEKVKNIFVIREQYTKLATEIRDRALASNGSDPAIAAKIDKLRALDPYANKDILTVLLEVQSRVKNLGLLKSTMSSAFGKSAAGDLAGAVADYVAAFSPESELPALYWREFVDAGYDILDRRDADAGQIVVIGADGAVGTKFLDEAGKIIRTDANGKPMRGFFGWQYETEANGTARSLVLKDFGGQKQIESSKSIVTLMRSLMNEATARSSALEEPGGSGPAFEAAMAALGEAFSKGDPGLTAQALAVALEAFSRLDADRRSLVGTYTRLSEIFQALPKEHSDGRARSPLNFSYLTYAGFFLRGRQMVSDYATRDEQTDPLWRPEAERDLSEGIAGLAFYQLARGIEGVESRQTPAIEEAWKAAAAAWDEGLWAASKGEQDRAGGLVAAAQRIEALWGRLGDRAGDSGLGARETTLIAGKAANLSLLDFENGISPALSKLAELRDSLTVLTGKVAEFETGEASGMLLADALRNISLFRGGIRSLEAALETEGTRSGKLKALADRTGAVLASLSQPADWPAAEHELWSSRLEASMSQARGDEVALVAFGFDLEVAALEKEYKERFDMIGKAAALMAGSPSPVPERQGRLDSFPSQAASILADEELRLSVLAQSTKGLGGRIRQEADWIRGDDSVAAIAARNEVLGKSTAEIQGQRSTLLATAAARKKAAATALAGARKSFTEAEATLAGSVSGLSTLARRQTARNALEEATNAREVGYSRFLDALGSDFDRQVWDEGVTRYAAIGRAINEARDQYAKLEVDRLLADAQHSYSLANFDDAYNSLSKANTLWKERYPSLTYPPLDFWLSLVRMARDTGNSRIIRQNDPLYREMTQYLSLARLTYEKGITLQKSGKRTDARQTFASALAIVANVTQTFPLNEDAGFLSLQILKATNEADFQSSLPNRIDDAAALLKKNPPAGYARIADLSHIEPNNSRLGRLLVQAEIAIGKRRPEPTASQKAQSLRLAEQARQLIKTGRAVDLTRAEQLLAQAMELDPNDRDAQTVSLNIQTLKGGGPEKVLGLTDSQNLNEARLYFSQGQYNQARDTLNALLKSEGTKTRDVLLLDQQLNQLNY